MEKALQEPQNVAIYKQHWDVYTRQPLLLDKLKLENPIMYHLLQHFRSLKLKYKSLPLPLANAAKILQNPTLNIKFRNWLPV